MLKPCQAHLNLLAKTSINFFYFSIPFYDCICKTSEFEPCLQRKKSSAQLPRTSRSDLKSAKVNDYRFFTLS